MGVRCCYSTSRKADILGLLSPQKRAVKRNIDRFPGDFMFELTDNEMKNLRCHFGTSSWGGTRYKPMVFTEQGVAMLSSALNSDREIRKITTKGLQKTQIKKYLLWIGHPLEELE